MYRQLGFGTPLITTVSRWGLLELVVAKIDLFIAKLK